MCHVQGLGLANEGLQIASEKSAGSSGFPEP